MASPTLCERAAGVRVFANPLQITAPISYVSLVAERKKNASAARVVIVIFVCHCLLFVADTLRALPRGIRVEFEELGLQTGVGDSSPGQKHASCCSHLVNVNFSLPPFRRFPCFGVLVAWRMRTVE